MEAEEVLLIAKDEFGPLVEQLLVVTVQEKLFLLLLSIDGRENFLPTVGETQRCSIELVELRGDLGLFQDPLVVLATGIRNLREIAHAPGRQDAVCFYF